MIATESGVSLTCGKCRHEADYMEFRRTVLTLELPPDHYQCPACKRAFCLEKVAEGYWLEGGLYIPPGRRVVDIPSFL